MANGKIAGLLAVLLGAVAALSIGLVAAQNSGVEVRIEARRLDDGRVEFALRERGGERILPRARYFPAETEAGRWLNASWITVGEGSADRPSASGQVRIEARRLDDGRVEFALRERGGERILPRARYFPAKTEAGRWLNASWITVGEGQDFTAAPTATPTPAQTLGEWERFEGENVEEVLGGYHLVTEDQDAILAMYCGALEGSHVFVVTREHLPGDSVSVTWRFSENSTPSRERWLSDGELDSAVFAPKSGSFRRALRNANGRLFIRITDNADDTVSYEFNVQGASHAAAALGCDIGA